MDTEEDGEAIRRIRDTLLPGGLSHTQSSYRSEAGHAIMATAKLTPAQWKRLGSAKLGSNTLRELVEQWAATADSLGSVEWKRDQVRSAFERSGDTRAARNQWIRVVNTILDLASWAELSEEDDRVLFSELRTVEARANGRERRGDSEAESEEAASPDEEAASPDEDVVEEAAALAPGPSDASEPSHPAAHPAVSAPVAVPAAGDSVAS